MSLLISFSVGVGIVLLSSMLRRAIRTGSSFVDRLLVSGRTPELYPDLDDQALCRVFDAQAARSLAQVPRVMVVPLAGENTESAAAGMGLAEILRRDLMLVRGLSVLGREDGRAQCYTHHEEVEPRSCREQWVVGGTTSLVGKQLRVNLWGVLGARHFTLTVEGDDVSQVLRHAVHGLAQELGGHIDAAAELGLRHGRPPSLEALVRLGEVFILARERKLEGFSARDELEVEAQALDVLYDAPDLSVLGELLGEHRLASMYALYQRDPYNVGLCFHLYCQLWNGQGFQRQAFQFVRRALELSPAHGKCNMVAPHAAIAPKQMGHHSELGYRLLPTNSFAASNYAGWLATHTNDRAQVIAVARAAVDLVPSDPANYERLIDAYEALRDFDRALEVAQELLGWFEPEIHPRTRYCLEQNPVVKTELSRGTFDPAAELKRRIERLEASRARPHTSLRRSAS
jgi:tetratricopeptide (TPR) repeat protein